MGMDYRDMKLRADLILEDMAKTYRERNAHYGENWVKVGQVMRMLFPNGVTLKTEEDFILFHWFDWTIGKFTRFVNTGMKQVDSVHDAAVYMAMIEAFIKTAGVPKWAAMASAPLPTPKRKSRKPTSKSSAKSTATSRGSRRSGQS